MGPLNRTRLLISAVLLLLCTVQLSYAAESGRVSRVYDGDTLEIAGLGKVRLLGIDVPERDDSPRDLFYWKHFRIPPPRLRQISTEAHAFTLQLAGGQQVRLAFDGDRKDTYGRHLAYVYLPDGSLLNQRLLEEGLASVFRRFDFRLKETFFRSEEQARTAGKGLWR